MQYCPYTNAELENSKITADHIVPLSLGGLNGFEAVCERDFNSKVGSRIEGRVVNDPLIAFARRAADARGHSNKPPVPVWKNSEFMGEPVQVSLGDTIKVWDSKKRVYLPNKAVVGRNFATTLTIDKFAGLQLAAKIAIGSCYFTGGKALLDAIDGDRLRWLATADMGAVQQAGADALPPLAQDIIMMDRFHPDVAPGGTGRMYRFLTEFTGRTTILLQPYSSSFAVHVGVLGMFVGTVCVPADGGRLNAAVSNWDLGEVFLLGPGTFERSGLREFLELALKHLPDDPSGGDVGLDSSQAGK